jgi:hypothetical protein
MCSDNTVAERLRQMAKEFQEQADRLAENAMPRGAMLGNGSGASESNHR